MNRPVEALAVPLWEDERGGLRVGGSRVLLELVLAAHQQGATPADIVRMYSSLDLADVLVVLAWALRHPGDAADYLRRREASAAEVRRKIESLPSFRPNLKEVLLARQALREQPHDAPDGG